MKGCIFCKIVAEELDSTKVFETGSVLAFLDANPITEDHTLVVPKEHYESIYDTPEEELHNVIDAAKIIAEEYKKEKDVDSVNLLNASGKPAGQEVPHFHLHVIPRSEDDDVEVKFH